MSKFSNILICVPSTNQMIRSGTTVTLLQMGKALSAAGIGFDVHNIDSAEIVTARDMFANMVLYSDRFDGLFFVDSDMAFDANLPVRMLALGRDLVGASYSRRFLDVRKLAAAYRQGSRFEEAEAAASAFTVIESWEGAETDPGAQDGFKKMAAVGMGCTFISKVALELMVREQVVGPRADLDAGLGRVCWSFFDNISSEGERLGEDYSFCYRWTKLLMRDLWVCTDARIRHIGTFEFGATYDAKTVQR